MSAREMLDPWCFKYAAGTRLAWDHDANELFEGGSRPNAESLIDDRVAMRHAPCLSAVGWPCAVGSGLFDSSAVLGKFAFAPPLGSHFRRVADRSALRLGAVGRLRVRVSGGYSAALVAVWGWF